MIIIGVSQSLWTNEVITGIIITKYNELKRQGTATDKNIEDAEKMGISSMSDLHNFQRNKLMEIVHLIRGKFSRKDSMTLEVLIVLEVQL